MWIVRGALIVWALCGAQISHQRAALWGDEAALWADAADQAPAKPRPRLNLGRQYELDGEIASAEDAYRQAMQLAAAPSRSVNERGDTRGIATANLALMRCRAGDRAGALALTGSLFHERPMATALLDLHTWLDQHRLSC